MNWNNRPAPRWGAADNNWAYGSVQRVQMLLNGLATRDKHDLASVTSAMNAAATQDLRSVALTPALAELLKAAPAPSPRAVRMLAILQEWRAAGSSRLDRDLDGVMDAGAGPAIWDALYPRLWSAAMPVKGLGPLIGESCRPCAGLPRRRRGVVFEKDLRAPVRRQTPAPVQRALLRQRRQAALRASGVGGARGHPGRPGRATGGRDQGADRVPAWPAADEDPLHQPAERDPAGDLVQRAQAPLEAFVGIRRAQRAQDREPADHHHERQPDGRDHRHGHRRQHLHEALEAAHRAVGGEVGEHDEREESGAD